MKDLSGKTFGYLKVIKKSENKNSKNKNQSWECVCLFENCGKKVIRYSNVLKSGRISSCGCKRQRKESLIGKRYGAQHYYRDKGWQKTKGEFEYRKKLDRMKRKFARKNGIYIEIDLRKKLNTEEWVNFILESETL